jgi:type IV pilus assembly protein PilE
MKKLYTFAAPKGNESAFTLIELLVVVLIIGILAAIALPQYKRAVLRSRAAEALIHARALKTAVDSWRLQNGDTASSNRPKFADLDIEIPNVNYTTEYNAQAQYWDYDLRIVNFCIRSSSGVVKQPVRYEICPNANNNIIQCLAELNDTAANNLCMYLGGTFSQNTSGWNYYSIK